ncbi:MAG: hemolysin III family protein [Planctomycetaceae bacterium]
MTALIRPADEMANILTHGVGFLLSLAAAVHLMQLVANRSIGLIVVCAVYAATLVLVYASSTLSHLFYDLKWRKFFRTLDQACIFLLIAGTCTPLSVTYLNHGIWPWLLGTMWFLAACGVARAIQVRDLSRSDKSLYGLMGFLPIIGLSEMSRSAPAVLVYWIIAGGACYSIGTVFLMLSARVRFSHAVWHLLVMAGSACHYKAIVLMIADR